MEKSILEFAEKKAMREQREISVYREPRSDLSEDIFYIVPEEKAGENVRDYSRAETFSPDTSESAEFERESLENPKTLEEGDRVQIEGDSSVHTVVEISPRQIVTNFGDKFRKSDGVEWGGGQKQITHKVKKQNV